MGCGVVNGMGRTGGLILWLGFGGLDWYDGGLERDYEQWQENVCEDMMGHSA